MTTIITAMTGTAALLGMAVVACSPALAAKECITKAAIATAGSTEQAKWYALETTVQAVSWGLWPGYVSTSKVEGYNVHDRYTCRPDAGQVTCHVVATFCKK